MPLKTHINQLIFWLAAIFVAQIASAQDKVSSLSIKPTTDFDQRFYYTPGDVQNVWGYRIGVLIKDKFKTGIGAYYMNETSKLASPINLLNGSTTNDVYSINKKLYLGTVYYEPYLIRRNLWEASLVFETGYGRTSNTVSDEKNIQPAQDINALFIPAGAGLSVNLKLPALFHIECLRWIGINAMAGYRTVIYQGDKQFDYNGAYWSISGAIFLDRVVDDVHHWKKEREIARNKRKTEITF